MSDREAVILLDHGSREPAAQAELLRFAHQVQEQLGVPVYAAHMSVAEPTLEQAVAQALADGVTQAAVCPLFLAAGEHLRRSVPRLLEEAVRRHPQIRLRLTPHLGLDPLMAQIIQQRLAQFPSPPPEPA